MTKRAIFVIRRAIEDARGGHLTMFSGCDLSLYLRAYERTQFPKPAEGSQK